MEASRREKLETADARRIQGDAKTPGEKPSTAGEGKTGAEPSTPAAMPARPPARGTRPAWRTRWRWREAGGGVARLSDRLNATWSGSSGEKRELDIEIAIRKGVIELSGKEPGAVPENLTNREKAILVKQTSEKLA